MVPFKAASILECPLQRLDRIFLDSHPVFFFSSHISPCPCLLYLLLLVRRLQEKFRHIILYPCVDNECTVRRLIVLSDQYSCECFFIFLHRHKQQNLKQSCADHYTSSLAQTHATERRRIVKRIRPWVEEGIRRIKRWIWRWIWFPQATPRRLTQVEYEWGKCVCVCVCEGWWDGVHRERLVVESERTSRSEGEMSMREGARRKGSEWMQKGGEKRGEGGSKSLKEKLTEWRDRLVS